MRDSEPKDAFQKSDANQRLQQAKKRRVRGRELMIAHEIFMPPVSLRTMPDSMYPQNRLMIEGSL